MNCTSPAPLQPTEGQLHTSAAAAADAPGGSPWPGETMLVRPHPRVGTPGAGPWGCSTQPDGSPMITTSSDSGERKGEKSLHFRENKAPAAPSAGSQILAVVAAPKFFLERRVRRERVTKSSTRAMPDGFRRSPLVNSREPSKPSTGRSRWPTRSPPTGPDARPLTT